MKKLVFIALAAFALFSCNKEEVTVENEVQPQPLKYAFKVADKPSFDTDTRAVKESWVQGDKIRIVFDDKDMSNGNCFTTLEYKESGEWGVSQGSILPNAEGGTLDAVYLEKKGGTYNYFGNMVRFEFPTDVGQYFYLTANDVPYTVKEDNTVEFSLSLDFEKSEDRTYAQFRVTGLEGKWNFILEDSKHEENSLVIWSPIWTKTDSPGMFTHETYTSDRNLALGVRDDGYYKYLSVKQDSPEITITLQNADTEEKYCKTFSKKISGKCAAITFKGPQFDESGTVINGWNKVISFKDPEVKQLCLDAGWDKDGDKTLSIDEAAAVTDLGEIFKDNTDITSFNELQYFSGLTSIAKEAFMNCSSLASVILPITVTEISEGAFYKSGLTSIVIPAAVNDIKLNPFQGCPMESITVDSNNEKYDSRDGCNAIIESESNSLFVGCKNTVIPESVTTINNSAFSFCEGLLSITIPDSVNEIKQSAFVNSGLGTVTIGTGIESIGTLAFSSENLKTVIIKATNPPSIRNNTFRDGIKDVFVPVESVDVYKEKWSQLADKIKAIPSNT